MDIRDKSGLPEVFSRVSSRYDFLNRVLSFDQDRRWRRVLVDLAAVGENARILDLCTGTGELAIEFARKESTCRVTAVDFSAGMLKTAETKIAKSGFGERIRLWRADVTELPFEARSFDVAAMGFGLRNLIDYRKGLGQMVRLVKEGGQVLILEFSPPSRKGPGVWAGFFIHRMLPFIAGLFGGSPAAYRYLSSSIRHFLSPQQIMDAMKEAGMKNIYRKEMLNGVVNIFTGSP